MINPQTADKPIKSLPTRRDFLRGLARGGMGLGLLAGTFGAYSISSPLWEQYSTWQAADQPVETFLQTYGAQLSAIHFGENLCPDYRLMAAEVDPERTVQLLVDYFGCRHVRLGLWWSTHVTQGMDAYDPWIEALLKRNVNVVLGYGVKSPFPPETHFPEEIERQLAGWGVERGSVVYADSPLGKLGLEYSDRVLTHLERAFGLDSFYGFNPENEFDAHFGRHLLAIGEDLLHAQAARLAAADRPRRLLLNTAFISPFGQTASLTMAVKNALALRAEFPNLLPIVGADIYEETGSGRIRPNVYIDTFAGVRLRHGNQLMPNAVQTLRQAEIPLEVTEFQVSDWITEPREYGPGSRVHIQYLLARVAEYLLPEPPLPDPFIVRLWEMSAILLNLLEDEQSFYANDGFALIQRINQGGVNPL